MISYLLKVKEKDILSLKSDFVTASFEGQIDVPNIFNSLDYLNPHFPLLMDLLIIFRILNLILIF